MTWCADLLSPLLKIELVKERSGIMKSDKDWVDPFVEDLCSVEKIENSKTLDRRLSNLVRRIQADALREAARFARALRGEIPEILASGKFGPHGYDDLSHRADGAEIAADRIEQYADKIEEPHRE